MRKLMSKRAIIITLLIMVVNLGTVFASNDVIEFDNTLDVSSITGIKDFDKVLSSELKDIYKEGYELPSQPTTAREFAEIFLMMAEFGELEHTFMYDGISFEFVNSDEVSEVISEGYRIFSRKYPEVSSFYSVGNFVVSGNDVESQIELELLNKEYTSEEIDQMMDEMLKTSIGIVENLHNEGYIKPEMTETEKAYILYQWLALYAEYDETLAPEGFNGYGLLLNQKGVCQGYTSIYNILCAIEGIEVQGITGYVSGSEVENHVWTLARLDGKVVHIDATWGDPVGAPAGYVDVDYFAKNSEVMKVDHIWDPRYMNNELEEMSFVLPEAVVAVEEVKETVKMPGVSTMDVELEDIYDQVMPTAVDETEECAEKLSKLNVFKGSDKGFELDRKPTRLEGIIMLIRLLGNEEAALNFDTSEEIFTDVPKWGMGYTNYAFKNGLTDGIGNNEFGTDQEMSAKSYFTFMLRALGYDDAAGDFAWDTAIDFAESKDIITADEMALYKTLEFTRADVAILSYNVLNVKQKDGILLVDKLISIGALDESIAKEIGVK